MKMITKTLTFAIGLGALVMTGTAAADSTPALNDQANASDSRDGKVLLIGLTRVYHRNHSRYQHGRGGPWKRQHVARAKPTRASTVGLAVDQKRHKRHLFQRGRGGSWFRH